MKLSIIPIDKTVCEDGVCYTNLTWDGTPIDVHALQWQDVSGWIEYNDGKPNQDITVLPDWADNAMTAWSIANAPPTPRPMTADENKTIARSKLEATDWTTIPDVADPTKSNPYLANSEEFVVYRNSVRQIAINPVAGNIDWATEPQTIWQTV
jgi:hypothetical protein